MYEEQPSKAEEKRIIEMFEDRFFRAISALCSREVRVIYPHGLRMEEVGDGDVWDIVGMVEFNVEPDTRSTGVFMMGQSSIHACVKIGKCYVDIADEKRDKLQRCIDAVPLQSISRQAYLAVCAIRYFVRITTPEGTEPEKPVRDLVAAGNYPELLAVVPLQSDVQKLQMLRSIFSDIVPGDGGRACQLAENILNSLELDNGGVFASIHPVIAFNTHFRNKYTELLGRYAKLHRSVLPEQRAWLDSDEVRKRCIVSFFDTAELPMYFDELTLSSFLARRDVEEELPRAIDQIPDVAMRCKIYTCGFILAGTLEDSCLALYFFIKLEVFGSTPSEARQLCAAEMEEYENLEFSVELFLALALDAPKTIIKKIYDWCFLSGALHLYLPYITALFRKTHTDVGTDFVLKYVMLIEGNKWIYHAPICALNFYIQLLGWMDTEGIRMRRDVAGLIKDFIETMEHDSRIVSSKYLNNLPSGRVGEFHRGLRSLRNMLEDTLLGDGSVVAGKRRAIRGC